MAGIYSDCSTREIIIKSIIVIITVCSRGRAEGTRDQITNLRILMHKAREHQQPLYMCFVDFKKAFDSISHDKLWVTVMDVSRHVGLWGRA